MITHSKKVKTKNNPETLRLSSKKVFKKDVYPITERYDALSANHIWPGSSSVHSANKGSFIMQHPVRVFN